jgi:hypothetical protein
VRIVQPGGGGPPGVHGAAATPLSVRRATAPVRSRFRNPRPVLPRPVACPFATARLLENWGAARRGVVWSTGVRALPHAPGHGGDGDAHASCAAHRFAGRRFENGVDSRVVGEMLGHANIATTQRYVGVSRQLRRRTAQTLMAGARVARAGRRAPRAHELESDFSSSGDAAQCERESSNLLRTAQLSPSVFPFLGPNPTRHRRVSRG